jgi:class 3 adenylate cyclase/tRNA A-37 threonylcarbamoyl transferase component Bud32
MSVRQIGGKYTLEHRIAGGGMGNIWVALDAQLQRRVALKLMTVERMSSASAREQFEREATAVAQLKNPHVVQIYDYGVDDDSPYIVMELLEGEDLEARLTRLGRLSPAAAAQLLRQTAKALTAAHTAGIVHRDLKPANLFLARIDNEEVLKVLDFGLARLASEEAQGAGKLMGTPRYMSPEQMRGEANLDHRSDLWSLGVVLYRALTGQFPFSQDAYGELMRNAGGVAILPPSGVVPELGKDMDAFFARALSAEPAQRFQSAREMANAFTALLEAGKPTRATKLLVVDDEPDAALLMKQRFRKQIRNSVYEFLFAHNGEDAMEQLRQHPDIEIVLSDINMPKMDGLTFLSRVGEVNPLVKVIIISAYSDMSNIRVAMNRGAFDFLVKPVDFQDLENTIVKTLKHVTEIRRTLRFTEENNLLRMFVHSGIVERLLPSVLSSDVISSERVEATVAFLDVKDFTGVTRSEHPDAVVQRLNANFEALVPELTARGGVVDKFVGDAVMAVFRGQNHASRALEACLAARAQLQTLAFRSGPDSPYSHGVCVGVDSGALISGSIGSKALGRLDYTVLGDVVNTAARLCGEAQKNQILLSEELRQKAGDRFECSPAGTMPLPGRETPVTLHNLVRSHQVQVTASDATASIDQRGLSSSASQPLLAAAERK